jgi:tRNA(fMet)-specific endonuclease VapC
MSGSEVALDSSVAIRFLRNDSTVLSSLYQHNRWMLPVPVVAELCFGALNSQRPNENMRTVRELIMRCSVPPMGQRTAEVHAELRLRLSRQGTPIPQNDLWIASVCIEHGVPLMSDDSHFDRTPALRRIQPPA